MEGAQGILQAALRDNQSPDREPCLPSGLKDQTILTHDEAEIHISSGALLFRAGSLPAHHAVDNSGHFHGILELSGGTRIWEATSSTTTLASEMSFPLDESLEGPAPWMTLEQPSMTLAFGRYPGTVTFGRYIAELNHPSAPIQCSPKIRLRKVGLSQIFDRLKHLQDVRAVPFASTAPEKRYLWGQLLLESESEIHNVNNGTLEGDIDVLSSLLNSDVWIDLSDKKKQSVGGYYASGTYDTSAELFFHQMLLSIELDRRIGTCSSHEGHSSGYMLIALPRRVAWSVAMSRRFNQNLAFEEFQSTAPHVGHYYRLVPQTKFAQMEKVLDVGYALKWPTMEQVEARMMVESGWCRELTCQWDSSSSTFLSGATLPGPAASWQVLTCLIDSSPAHRRALGGLHEMRTQSGFQYLSNTYWHWECIVGKVLGAMEGSKNVAGWIGPCLYTPDLARVHYVRIYQNRAPERMTKQDLRGIEGRSEPLGTLQDRYPVTDFHSPSLGHRTLINSVRVEKLAFAPRSTLAGSVDPSRDEHHVAVQFAANGCSYPVRLRHDVSFIAAAACFPSSHLLFNDYKYQTTQVDKLLYKCEWGGMSGRVDKGGDVAADDLKGPDKDKVLVIEAFGPADNAVLARAWCSYMGLSAVVACQDHTCLACTIRAAYASRVAVVIYTLQQQYDDTEPAPGARTGPE
ncbi:MAG: hypothetical protein LQ346_003660 [Caloplaca aetnensis]|nr:MAG: hypothetical protein LQ346_003660 [Caloplaca aetnensis]